MQRRNRELAPSGSGSRWPTRLLARFDGDVEKNPMVADSAVIRNVVVRVPDGDRGAGVRVATLGTNRTQPQPRRANG